jgi:putative membrane protein insertion efficiency factor
MTRTRRRVVSAASGAALLLLAFNGQAIALGAIRGYHRALAPAAARVGLRCRFVPTCSRYAEVVIARDGLVAGGAKALARIARCGPWTPMGTRDDP